MDATNARPAGRPLPVPRYRTLPAGTLLWHVTRRPPGQGLFRSVDHGAGETPSGRFDPCPAHDFTFAVVALDDVTALASVLLRDMVPGDPPRPVPAAAVLDRRLEVWEPRRPLTLIGLVTAEELSSVGEDTWLVQAGVGDFPITRCRGHHLRDHAPVADGLIWRSLRQPDGLELLLFGDRCAPDLVPSGVGPQPLDRLDQPDELDRLNRRLALLRTYVVPAGAVGVDLREAVASR